MNNRGSTTVFISLVMVGILFVIFALFESSRIVSAKAVTEERAYMAADACFSKYAKELFDDYGIFGLYKNEVELRENFSFYLETSEKRSSDIFKIQSTESEIESVNYLTDQNGQYMAEQVEKYMEYQLGADAAKEILERISGLKKNEKLQEFFDKLTLCMNILQMVESSVKEIHSATSKIKQDVETVEDAGKEMNKLLNEIENFSGTRLELLQKKGEYEAKCLQAKACIEEINQQLDFKTPEVENYKGYSENIGSSMNELEEALRQGKDSFAKELYDSLIETVQALNSQMTDYDSDYYQVYKCEELEKEIVKKTDPYMEYLEKTLELIQKDEFEKIRKKDYEMPDVSEYEINYEEIEGDSDFLETIMDLFEDGMLALVVNDSSVLSAEKIKIDKLPSNECSYTEKAKYAENMKVNESIRKAIFSQYVFDHFHNFLNPSSKSALQYEIEYMIGGKKSDKKNLEIVVAELVGMREGFNLAYLLTDTEKCNEAEMLAMSTVGSVGISAPLVLVAKYLILGAWATAESVVDVRMLLDGKKLALTKTSESWQTQLMGLDEFSKKNYSDKGDKSGFGYVDYLRMILLSQNKVKQMYRTMDLIQLNLQKKYCEDFKMKECINSVHISTEYYVSQMFTSIGNGKKKYKNKLLIEYSY